MTTPLILASASPRRLALLAQIGITPMRVEPPECDETPHKNELPEGYAKRIAEEKARIIATRFADAWVLAADTVVYCGRRILPKAMDAVTARTCLETLSGRRHRVMTAVTLIKGEVVRARSVMTMVRFKHLSFQEIEHYLLSGEWEGKAGGYAIQGKAAGFIPAINGSYSNVVGLPLCEVRGMLESVGIRQ